MTLRGRELPLAPRPLELAARIAGRPGAFLLRCARSGAVYLGCDPLERSSELDPEPRLGLSTSPSPLERVPRWVGLLPYEAFRGPERAPWVGRTERRAAPLLADPLWQRYAAVLEVTDRVLLVGDDPEAMRQLAKLTQASGPAAVGPAAPRLRPLATGEDPPAHAARIREALELIRSGEIYQVNLARRLELEVDGAPAEILRSLGREGWAPYAAAIDADGLGVVASSPELCLSLEPGGWLLTQPIKGTRPRGRDARHDRAQALELAADPKERAELTMVIDVERNDLGRVARRGSVRVLGEPSVVTHPTVHHRVASVAARLREGVERTELLRSFLPSGSVTGAPKLRAMEAIAALEPHRRGLYTGAYGMLAHHGGLELAMAIRVLSYREGVGHYFAGGGIVIDSDPDREVLETGWKTRQLALRLAEGDRRAPESWPRAGRPATHLS